MRMHALNLICFGPAERAGQVEFHRLRRGAVGLWAEFHHNRHLFRPVHHAGILVHILVAFNLFDFLVCMSKKTEDRSLVYLLCSMLADSNNYYKIKHEFLIRI